MEAKDEIIHRLMKRWPDLWLMAGRDCSVCGHLGEEYTYDYYPADADDDIESALAEIAEAGDLRLRECRVCGALWLRDSQSLTAADNLFATHTVRLRRISSAKAITLLGGSVRP